MQELVGSGAKRIESSSCGRHGPQTVGYNTRATPGGERVMTSSQPYETAPQHTQVSPGSIASTGLGVGDVILRVGDADTAYLSHSEAQNRIKAAGNLLQLHIAKGVRDSQSTASPQPQKVASARGAVMSSGGVHDLFRDMYGQPPLCAATDAYRSPPPPCTTRDTPGFYSRPPPPPAAPSAFSPAPRVTTPNYATRLNQQLTKMNLDNAPDTPSNYGGHSSPGGYNPYSPPPTNYYDQQYGGPPSPASYPSPNSYCSPSYQEAPPMAPPLPPLSQPQPMYRSVATPPPAMPDAVLNMAAKGAPDKKPWAYAPDASMLKEHRDRVRRRKASGPDITQSATYKMIHGLDEPQQRAQRPAPEGTAQVPIDACVSEPFNSDPTNTHSLDACDNNNISASCDSPTSFTTVNKVRLSPVNPISPLPGQVRQGLSFYLLKCLYDSDESDQDASVTRRYSGSGSVSPTNSVPSNAGTCTDTASDGSLSPTSSNTWSAARNTRSKGYGQYPVRQPSADDELSFSGVRNDTYDHIPSRAFHKLQSLTGGGEVDRSSIRQGVSGVATKPSRRILRRAESAPGPRDEDDGVDISYVGANIPSRSFRMLQQSVGEPTDYDTTSRGPDVPQKRHGRKVKVVTLRSKQQADPAARQQHVVEDRATDF